MEHSLGLFGGGCGLAVVTYIAILVLFPDWRQSIPQMVALGALVLVTVAAFLAALAATLGAIQPVKRHWRQHAANFASDEYREQIISAAEIPCGPRRCQG